MTEETPIGAEDSVDQESSDGYRANIRRLEERAKAGDQAVEELAQLQRELTFRDAGIDPRSKQGQYFMRGYQGDMEVEVIRSEFAELGLSRDSNPLVAQEPPVDYGAEQRIAMAADDAGPVSTPEFDELIRATGGDESLLRPLMESHGYTWNAAV